MLHEIRISFSVTSITEAEAGRRTCVPLEARAPLGAAYHFVGVRVARLEEGVGARLVHVQVQALDLRLVQLEVKVCVQTGEHPAQGVLANRRRPDLKLCRRGGREIKNERGSMQPGISVLFLLCSSHVTHCSSPASGS